MTIGEKMKGLLEHLNSGIYEKREIIGLSLLATLAGGKGVFLLGPVGIAKSLVASRLKFIFPNARSFEYLMTKYSTPDEIFGNISVSKLKNDVYERLTDGFLPTADVAFLDEIWKASSSIQNALLRIINEKIFRNGSKDFNVPLKALISASNELPEKGQDAIWDRFLIRYLDSNIRDRDNFDSMISDDANLSGDCIPEKYKISFEEYEQIVRSIGTIVIPENIFNVIHIIRVYIQNRNEEDSNKEKQLYISDRRWKSIIRLMRASAFLNDRKEVNLSDCFLIAHCIWNEPEQFTEVSDIIGTAILRHGFTGNQQEVKKAKERLSELEKEINEVQNEPNKIQKAIMKMNKMESVSQLTATIKKQKAAIQRFRNNQLASINIFITDAAKAGIANRCAENAQVEIEQIELDLIKLTEALN